MIILGIETSGKIASCGLWDSEKKSMVGEYTIKTEKTHSQIILPMCEKLLKELDLKISDVDAFAVSKGPGSYTGIRIGISAVKACTFALDKKCCGVSELFSLAVRTNIKNGIVCSLIKARTNLYYCSVYKNPDSKDFGILFDECITDDDSINEFLESLNENIVLTGPDSNTFFEKYKNSKYSLVDSTLREYNALSLCKASEYIGFNNPDELNASYLQLTEAERNLNK